MIHGILHVLGIDTQQSYWYDFWSGIATQASLVFVGVGLYRKHNCHVSWCWRLAKHPVEGTPYTVCRRHHPELPRSVDHLHVLGAYHQHRRWIGKSPLIKRDGYKDSNL